MNVKTLLNSCLFQLIYTNIYYSGSKEKYEENELKSLSNFATCIQKIKLSSWELKPILRINY